jgi:hypothetical protein
MKPTRRCFLDHLGALSALGAAGVLGGLPSAHALDAPGGPVVLTISGKISHVNDGQTATFSMAMLEALPQKTFSTSTPWYPGKVEFTGPLLRDVLAAAGAKGEQVVALALNDYKTEIPISDATQFDMVIARLMDGKPMAIRNRGPLFIVYPYDSKPELRAERYYNRSAWQLSRLIVQ